MSPLELWDDMLYAYPSLADQFSDAKPVTEIQIVPQLQRRLGRAAGPNWALLPYSYAFSSPMFSTGIAWSLVAVERIARAFEDPATLPSAFDRYDALLRDEAVHLEHLVAGAYATRHDFDAFVEYAMLYFAAASFSEASQRLLDVAPDGHEWCWDGFLGARDPQLQPLIELVSKDLRTAQPDTGELASRIREGIASRNVAGLSDASRNRLYPVDLDDLVKKADLLGLTTEEIRLQLPRLRGVG
jgi:FADH2 O2-dependent halogenase